MRKLLIGLSVAAFSVAPVLAQNIQPGGPGPRPTPQAPKKPGLAGTAKGKFIIKQLNLTPDQMQQAEALVDTHYAQPTDDPDTILARVRALTEELRKAEETKDKAEIDRISEELRKIGRGETDEGQFLDNLRLILKDDQKARLDATLDRLKSNPTGELRPIDVYRIAKGLSLSAEEVAKLEAVTATFREQASSAAPVRDQAGLDAQHADLLNSYITQVRDALPEGKRADFTSKVDGMRAK
ncbi:MAG: hypothetical protein IT450_16885 [Phycisphaerales bacterium]|nr:hypothetical protein [Phycisphaerales bacterium]